MKWTSEDIKLVEKFIEIKNKGYYCDGTQLTDVYNRVLEKHLHPTNCGSCIRQRVNELESALTRFKKQMEKEAISSHSESVEGSEATVIKEEENKVSEEPRKKVGRPRKNV